MLETTDFEEWFSQNKHRLAADYYGPDIPHNYFEDDTFMRYCEGRFNEERDEL